MEAFQLKSAYHMLKVATWNERDNRWKAVWNYQGPHRIHFFLWLACKQKLLTNETVTPDTSHPQLCNVAREPVVVAVVAEEAEAAAVTVMLSHRNDPRCPAANFYTYDAFIAAAKLYPDFAAKGNNDTRKMEVAAFLGQTSHQTNGFGGYCYNEALNCSASYCENKPNYPCYAGVSYCGRGPMQLSWNYNYGQFGESIGQKEELLQHPEVLKTDVTLSFMSALWFWMTAQPPKPSCHSVMTGEWIPSEDDVAAGRLPGYGVTTNIINGGLECGRGPDSRVDDRIKFYETYCDILGVSYGLNLDCYYQRPFNLGFLVESI
ncbi:hypothetical protein GOBAR_DD13715 [Gossypium barbadense]|nr:hypothetical protein GOBAR_DD13715 [Gossypium barbadense]